MKDSLLKKMYPAIRIFGIPGCRIVGIQIHQSRAGLPFFKSLNKKGFSKTTNNVKFMQSRLEIGSIAPPLAH
jgi:hypothetical protein